jgi:hypothetical protein
MKRVKELLELLGGARDLPDAWLGRPAVMLAWGLWWGLLAVLILCFSGQTSKFIYIDF